MSRGYSMLARLLPCVLAAMIAAFVVVQAEPLRMARNDSVLTRRAGLKKWDWTSTKKKVYGTNLGGLFVLERWMNEDWMVREGGDNAWDEYTMSKEKGNDMVGLLNNHFDNWFTEDDIDTLHSAGINMLRIPIGYWAFVDAKEANEPYKTAKQLDKLGEIMQWSMDRNMYVLIDMHGMPGSQNNDQSSGRNHTSNESQQRVDWYSDANQKLSRKVIHKLLNWLDNQSTKSTVAGITTVNEPKVYDNDEYQRKLFAFYDFSLKALKPHGIALVAHHAFVNNPYGYWNDYASKQEPGTFVLDDHPYPAWFQNPEPKDRKDVINRICSFRGNMKGFPAPVLMGEFSGISAINGDEWNEEYIKTQLKVFGWSAGSTFFNFKMKNAKNRVLALPPQLNKKYSMIDLLDGTIPNRDTSKSVIAWTNSLTNNCGNDPHISW